MGIKKTKHPYHVLTQRDAGTSHSTLHPRKVAKTGSSSYIRSGRIPRRHLHPSSHVSHSSSSTRCFVNEDIDLPLESFESRQNLIQQHHHHHHPDSQGTSNKKTNQYHHQQPHHERKTVLRNDMTSPLDVCFEEEKIFLLSFRNSLRKKRVNRTIILTLTTPFIAFLVLSSLSSFSSFVSAAVVKRSVITTSNQEPKILSHSTITEAAVNASSPHNVDDDDSFWSIFNDFKLPLWLNIVCIVFLLILSGLFSGLNLGLMALDQNDLKVIASCGTKREKQFAAKIAPVRARGNFLLCTLLLGNVLVNTTLTTLLDDVTGSGAIAVLSATLSIVVFGEILPQAICSRHGLAVGARTIGITYIFMALTAPLAYPISVALDKLLGEEIGVVYNREQLTEYIRITRDHNRLEDNELGIITGALALKSKTAKDVMTPMSSVFMLPLETKLNYETVNTINNRGFSRIPVYGDGDPENMVGLLHLRDLALIDPSDEVEIKTVIDYYKHPLIYVYTDTRLDFILQEFKAGKSHMALVKSIQTKPSKPSLKWMRVLGTEEHPPETQSQHEFLAHHHDNNDDEHRNHHHNSQETKLDGSLEALTTVPENESSSEEEGDPYYRLEGIITLEDIIEEIIGSEIIDEGDVLAMKLRDRMRESGMYGKKTSTVTAPSPDAFNQASYLFAKHQLQRTKLTSDQDNAHCATCCKCTCGKVQASVSPFSSQQQSVTGSTPVNQSFDADVVSTGTNLSNSGGNAFKNMTRGLKIKLTRNQSTVSSKSVSLVEKRNQQQNSPSITSQRHSLLESVPLIPFTSPSRTSGQLNQSPGVSPSSTGDQRSSNSNHKIPLKDVANQEEESTSRCNSYHTWSHPSPQNRVPLLPQSESLISSRMNYQNHHNKNNTTKSEKQRSQILERLNSKDELIKMESKSHPELLESSSPPIPAESSG